jgi:hypothetical protein
MGEVDESGGGYATSRTAVAGTSCRGTDRLEALLGGETGPGLVRSGSLLGKLSGVWIVVVSVSRMWRWLRPRDTSGHHGPRDDEGEPL